MEGGGGRYCQSLLSCSFWFEYNDARMCMVSSIYVLVLGLIYMPFSICTGRQDPLVDRIVIFFGICQRNMIGT